METEAGAAGNYRAAGVGPTRPARVGSPRPAGGFISTGKWGRSGPTMTMLVFFVLLAAGAIGFVCYNLSDGLSENRAACTTNAKDVLELKGDVRAIRESFEDFRTEQRGMNKEMLHELGKIQARLSK